MFAKWTNGSVWMMKTGWFWPAVVGYVLSPPLPALHVFYGPRFLTFRDNLVQVGSHVGVTGLEVWSPDRTLSFVLEALFYVIESCRRHARLHITASLPEIVYGFLVLRDHSQVFDGCSGWEGVGLIDGVWLRCLLVWTS